MQYRLASHVYVCRTEDGAVFLDLKQNKYVGIASQEAIAVGPYIEGWPECMQLDLPSTEAPSTSGSELARELHRSGLLSGPKDGKPARPVNLCRGTVTLLSQAEPAWGQIRPKHVLLFLAALARAWASIRWGSLDHVARSLRNRRARAIAHAGVGSGATLRAFEIFRCLSAVLFTTRDRCLLESLTLVNYLACFDVYPNWVIGVRTGPFAAHSWVQDGPLVFNAQLEQANDFMPILVA